MAVRSGRGARRWAAAAVAASAVALLLLAGPIGGAEARRRRRKKGAEDLVPLPKAVDLDGFLLAPLLPSASDKESSDSVELAVGAGFSLAGPVGGRACVSGKPWTNRPSAGSLGAAVAESPEALHAWFGPAGGSSGDGLLSGFLSDVAADVWAPAAAGERAAFGVVSVSGFMKKLKSARVSNAGDEAAKAAGDDAGAFAEACGEFYLSEIRRGAAAAFKVVVHFSDAEADSTSLQWEVADATGLDALDVLNATAAFVRKNNRKTLSGNALVTVHMQQWGGFPRDLFKAAGDFGKTVDGLLTVSCSTEMDSGVRKDCAKSITRIRKYLTTSMVSTVVDQGEKGKPVFAVAKRYSGVKSIPTAFKASACDKACVAARGAATQSLFSVSKTNAIVESIDATCESAGMVAGKAVEKLSEAVDSDLERFADVIGACAHATGSGCSVALDELTLQSHDAVLALPHGPKSNSGDDLAAWFAKLGRNAKETASICTVDADGETASPSCHATPWGMRREQATKLHKRLRTDEVFQQSLHQTSMIIRNKHPLVTLRPHDSTAMNEGRVLPEVPDNEDPCPYNDCGGGKPTWYWESNIKGRVHYDGEFEGKTFATLPVPGCTEYSIPTRENNTYSGVFGCVAYDVDYGTSLNLLPKDTAARAYDAADEGIVAVMCVALRHQGPRKGAAVLMTRDEFTHEDISFKDIFTDLQEQGSFGEEGTVVLHDHVLSWEFQQKFVSTGQAAAIYELSFVPGIEDSAAEDLEESEGVEL